ncbi:MAG: isochorismatase family protein [Deltaproteobacteria bacterium]|nr:isochorismatase family protein [Candidatus Zymogenaceae bacterium]
MAGKNPQNEPSRPTTKDTAVIVIDVQEALASAMKEKIADKIIRQTITLIEAAKILDLPTVVTEQYPRGLGPTLPVVRDALGDRYRPLEKLSFSVMGERYIADVIENTGARHLILAGMETHVCVLQSALDLCDAGYLPHIAADAVCSRTELDWETGITSMRDAGVGIGTVEQYLFLLLERAGSDQFKAISKMLK